MGDNEGVDRVESGNSGVGDDRELEAPVGARVAAASGTQKNKIGLNYIKLKETSKNKRDREGKRSRERKRRKETSKRNKKRSPDGHSPRDSGNNRRGVPESFSLYPAASLEAAFARAESCR